ncbi:MAG: ABC transporter permease subunit [Planctomycetota bacterium]
MVASASSLGWNLDALGSWQSFAAAWRRLWDYLAAFASPDLSADMLRTCGGLALETLAVAFLGVALGLLASYPLALGATRCLVHGGEPASWPTRALQHTLLEGCRLLLDVLRGVPDIAWAIVLANLTGVNAVTGVLAIAISVAGIFGKVLSEQWDNVDPARYQALRTTGASRAAVFLYGVQPLAARTTLSFLLMRTECAVRNASVIGVVGGGGLGAQLWDEYTDGSWSRVATVLLALLLVTATTDVLANLIRQRLRVDPNHPRATGAIDRSGQGRRRLQVLVAIVAVVGGSAALLAEPFAQVAGELRRIDWDFAGPYTAGLFVPDLSAATLAAAARQAVVPIAIGILATVLGGLAAAALAYPASVAFQLDAHRFVGENLPAGQRRWRWCAVVATRAFALFCRGVPEVAWVILLAVFFRIGVTPCVLAVAIHSCGVLHRVFTESLDNVAYHRLERIGGTCRAQVFLYGALPRAWPDWRTYAFFQFEVNMRIGVALGIVGAGGLGHAFKFNLDWRQHGAAATFLWTMIVLTVLVDRCSRWLQLRRNRC